MDRDEYTPDEIQQLKLRLEAAAREQSLSGFLRRSIHSSKRHLTQIARAVDCDALLISRWLEGLDTLPSDVIDRLAAELHVVASPQSTP